MKNYVEWTRRNYVDKDCQWGYITLCDKCVVALTARDRRSIDVSTELPEFPLTEQCEMCGGIDYE